MYCYYSVPFEEWIGYSLDIIQNCDDIIIPKGKQVYCIEDNKIFNTPKECAIFYHLNVESLYHCCNHLTSTCGSEKKHFFYLSEYEKLTPEKIKYYLLNKNNKQSRQVYLINTNEIFTFIADACRKYNINNSSLIRSCKSISTAAGTYNNEPLL